MSHCDLNTAEQQRRKQLASKTRSEIRSHIKIEEEDETSLFAEYRDYILQISFGELHPLMLVYLAKALPHTDTAEQRQMTNDLNLHSLFGCHTVNQETGCYTYRTTHWLDTALSAKRFFEILDRCVDEADRGYLNLMVKSCKISD